MARDHARLKTSRNNDDDWRALTMDAQWLYDSVLTQQKLSYCGVLDYFPGRIAQMAAGVTEAKVRTAVKRLEKARFIVVDEDTAELLIRSFVRHDGVMDRMNMGKAMTRALLTVTSRKVRDAVLMELARLMEEAPRLAGWAGFEEIAPDEYAMATAMASTIPFPMTSGGR
jgi:hypothetical protein